MIPPRILILTPFRNEEHSLSHYLKSLTNIEYPPELIDVFWLENDSSDHTLKMLRTAQPKMPFHSTTLKSVEILGKIVKQRPGIYVKDLPTGHKRGTAWLSIWNEYFLSFVRKSEASYVLTWFADAVVPSTAIKDFLAVFAEKRDAGWVGGANYRRYPRHNDLGSPRPLNLATSNKVVEVDYIGHVWMSPRNLLANAPIARVDPDMHYSMIERIRKMGFKVYYQPLVFIQHVATDGKIYRTKPDWTPPKRNLPAGFYDDVFTRLQKYRVPAKYSTYKIVWDKVLEKLPLGCSVLDIGCGPGQFATLCIEAGHSYVGADFSKIAINRGRQIAPKATFHLVDITKDKSLLTKGDYDVATFIEFLEHIDEDLEVLSFVPEGKKIVLTVPKYWSKGHIRVFKTPDDVSMRYGEFVDIESLDAVAYGAVEGRLEGPHGPQVNGQWTIYVLSGMRRNG